MKVLVVLSALIAFTAAAALSPSELDMLEAFDYDTLFANDEHRNIVFNCMLEKGDCGDFKQVAELSREIVKNKCAECSPKQKAKYDTVMKKLHDNFEPFYNDLMKKIEAKQE
uniref:Putative chemosensory protein n=1 Tax=Sesamia inferens TaxID=492764 RepID=U5PZD6_SESIF|nr:putative chemosensory protein [Sesamia inferens]